MSQGTVLEIKINDSTQILDKLNPRWSPDGKLIFNPCEGETTCVIQVQKDKKNYHKESFDYLYLGLLLGFHFINFILDLGLWMWHDFQ